MSKIPLVVYINQDKFGYVEIPFCAKLKDGKI